MNINVQVQEVQFLIMRFLISVSLLLLINGEGFIALTIQKYDQESDVILFK